MSSSSPKAPAASHSRVRVLQAIGFGVYLVLALASVVWGLSADLHIGNPLRAEIHMGATREGSVFVTVRNRGDVDWTNVKIEVDGGYFVQIPRVAAGQQSDARMREFLSEYSLPRPVGLFYWEAVGVAPNSPNAPPDYEPRRVTVECEQGRWATDVSL